ERGDVDQGGGVPDRRVLAVVLELVRAGDLVAGPSSPGVALDQRSGAGVERRGLKHGAYLDAKPQRRKDGRWWSDGCSSLRPCNFASLRLSSAFHRWTLPFPRTIYDPCGAQRLGRSSPRLWFSAR